VLALASTQAVSDRAIGGASSSSRRQRRPGRDGARYFQAVSGKAPTARLGVETVDFGHCSLHLQAGTQRGLSATGAWHGPLPVMTGNLEQIPVEFTYNLRA